MKYGKLIARYIVEQGLIKKAVATRSGIKLKKFYRLLSTSTSMTIEDYESICRQGLNLDPSFFLNYNSHKVRIKNQRGKTDEET